MISWLLPAMLAGSAIAAAPLVIHLLLKPRPRKQMFAGLRLLRAAHFQGVRRQRISHWLLLLVRMVLLLVVVLGAARPVWRSVAAGDAGAPVAAVFCFDTSASMHYQSPRGSRLDAAVAWAESLLADERRFPPGSQFLVLDNRRTDSSSAVWTRDRDAAYAALHVATTASHDRGVTHMLADALHRLTTTVDSHREIYLFTDLAAHAWSAAPSQPASNPATQPSGRVDVFVLDVGRPENRSAALHIRRPAQERTPRGSIHLSPGRPATVTASVTAGDERVETQVELWLNGTMLTRSEPLNVDSGKSVDARLSLPPLASGIHFGELRLDRPDRLADDNAAGFVVDVGARVNVCVLSPENHDRSDVEVRRMATLLSPDSLPEDRRPFNVRVLSDSAIASPELDPARLIVWVEPAAVTADRLSRLRRLCENGATLLIVPGPEMPTQDWPRESMLGVTPTAIASPSTPIEFATDANTAEQSQPSHAVYRYVRWRVDPTATITRPFSNGDPAELESRIGAGRVVWWSYSLRPDWSDLGVRAASTLMRLHRLAQSADTGSQRTANVLCGETVELAVPADTGPLRVTRLTPSAGHSAPIERAAPGSTLRPEADAAGLYRVSTDVADRTAPPRAVAGWAVNLRESESDARRMTKQALLDLLNPMNAAVHHSPEGLNAVRRAGQAISPLDGYLLCGALVLLFIETWLARRVYRPATV